MTDNFENPNAFQQAQTPLRISNSSAKTGPVPHPRRPTQKAGVSKDMLPRLVLKELADNGLDAGAVVKVGELPEGGYYVDDDGPGIDPPKRSPACSRSRRPLVSTKLLRLPTRGASAMACAWSLARSWPPTAPYRHYPQSAHRASPRARRHHHGGQRQAVKRPVGTRIEIGFGPDLPDDETALLGTSRLGLSGTGTAIRASPRPGGMTRRIPRASRCQRQPPGPRSDRRARWLQRRQGRRDRRHGWPQPRRLHGRHPTAGREAAACRPRQCQQVNPKRLGAVGPEFADDAAYAVRARHRQFGAATARRHPFHGRGLGRAGGCEALRAHLRQSHAGRPANRVSSRQEATSISSAAALRTLSPRRPRTAQFDDPRSTSSRRSCRSPATARRRTSSRSSTRSGRRRQGGAQGASSE